MYKSSSLLARFLGWLLIITMIAAALLVFAPAATAEIPYYLFATVNPAEARAREEAKARAAEESAEEARTARTWATYYPDYPDTQVPDTQPISIYPDTQAPDTQPIVIGPIPPDTQPITVEPIPPNTQPIYVNPVTRLIGEGMTIASANVYDKMAKGSRVGSMKKGETFYVHQIAGNRFLIEQDDGTYGYVDMAKCNVDLYEAYHLAFETTRSADVYGSPKESKGLLLFTLPDDSDVTLTGFRGKWAMIRFGEEAGYTLYKNITVKN